MAITEWMVEREKDLLCHIEDELRSKKMANWYDIKALASELGYLQKIRPTANGSILVLTRPYDNRPGEEVVSYSILGIDLRAEEVISDLKRRQNGRK